MPSTLSAPLKRTRILTSRELGERIRASRKLAGMTQQDLADILEFSPRLIGDIERGKGGVAIEKVLRCCSEVGVRLYVEMSEEPFGQR